MNTRRPRYHRHLFPPEIISHAVWLYHRYCMSFRDVEDLLAERGIIVSYETVRQWCGKFGPHMSLGDLTPARVQGAARNDPQGVRREPNGRHSPVISGPKKPGRSTRRDTRTIGPKSRINPRDNATVRCEASRHPTTRSGSCTSTVSFRIYFAWVDTDSGRLIIGCCEYGRSPYGPR